MSRSILEEGYIPTNKSFYRLPVLRIDPKAPMVVSDLKIELEEGFKQVVKWKKGDEINGKNHEK